MLNVVPELRNFVATKFPTARMIKAVNHHNLILDNRVLLSYSAETGAITLHAVETKPSRKKKIYALGDNRDSKNDSYNHRWRKYKFQHTDSRWQDSYPE